MPDQWKIVLYGLANGAKINDFERPQTQISQSCHYLTLNVPETVRDTDIITMTRSPASAGIANRPLVRP